MNYKTLDITPHEKSILIVTLNRPNVRNAIDSAMMLDLKNFWQEITKSTNYRCVILTGAPPAFCAGADLKERNNISLTTWKEQRAILEAAMFAMLDCPIPIIAAVNGAAFGGGLELALASDFIYASKTASFSQSEVKVGLMPGALGTQNLPRAAGLRRAKELCFTGDVFSAKEALEWGIINKVCEPDQLIKEALTTAHKIAENAPLAITQSKQSLNASQHLDLKSGYLYEIEAYNRLLSTHDREEGIRAFNEKRKPIFNGE